MALTLELALDYYWRGESARMHEVGQGGARARPGGDRAAPQGAGGTFPGRRRDRAFLGRVGVREDEFRHQVRGAGEHPNRVWGDS